MVDYSADDDSDEELGAYIYSRTSRTAKLLREKVARNNETSSSTKHTNKSNNIRARKSKRKEPPSEGGGDAVPVLDVLQCNYLIYYAIDQYC